MSTELELRVVSLQIDALEETLQSAGGSAERAAIYGELAATNNERARLERTLSTETDSVNQLPSDEVVRVGIVVDEFDDDENYPKSFDGNFEIPSDEPLDLEGDSFDLK